MLGAAVHGSTLSPTLERRLDAALAYHALNHHALVVVTGGQGPGEDLPEGDAMRAYLVAHGVPEASVLVEDRATSTEENFAFSRRLLDATLPAGYSVAFVTSEFHVVRAERIAAASGLKATHLSCPTPVSYTHLDVYKRQRWFQNSVLAPISNIETVSGLNER